MLPASTVAADSLGWPIPLVTIAAIVLIAIELRLRMQPAYKAAQRIPGLYIWPLFGNTLLGVKLTTSVAIFQLGLDMARKFKCGYRYIIFNQLHYWPTLAHEVEVRYKECMYSATPKCFTVSWAQFLFNSSKNQEKSYFYRFMLPTLGDGLLKFLHTFREESAAFVAQLAAEDGRNEGTEVHDFVSRFTLNNICETAMGVRLNQTAAADTYREMLKESSIYLLRRYVNPFLHPDWVFHRTGLYQKVQACARSQHQFSGAVISQRRASNRTAATDAPDTNWDSSSSSSSRYSRRRYAMLDTLLEAEAAGQIDAAGIQEEVDTFMFEGFDTSSAALEFCLFTLAAHAGHQQLVYEEVRSAVDGNGGSAQLGVDQYAELRYLDLVIKETMRLYPPVPYMSRTCTEPVDLGHVVLPAGTPVHVHIFNLHRDAGQFPQPERFDPERFLPQNAEGRHPFAYIPFSAGMRNCIGQKFAMLEIKCLLASLLLEYRLEAVTRPEDLQFYTDMVLKTVKPIRVRFVRRDGIRD